MPTDHETVAQWLDRMAAEIRTAAGEFLPKLCIVGIHTGGVRVARELHERLGVDAPLGTLDISFYRDDFSRIGLHPRVRRSDLPFDVEDRRVLLVDDVVYSGRTIRAALNVLFDYGRPRQVMLATLVERSGHELPIRADFAGTRLELEPNQRVRLNPDDLGLTIEDMPRRGRDA